MDRRPINFSARGGVLALVLVVSACQDTTGQQASSGTEDVGLDLDAAMTGDAAPAADTGTGTQWSYSENKDDLRDSTDYIATIMSENTVNFDAPYEGEQHLQIVLRKSKAYGNNVMFRIEQGQFMCGIYDCEGTISIDGKVESLSLAPPEDHGYNGSVRKVWTCHHQKA